MRCRWFSVGTDKAPLYSRCGRRKRFLFSLKAISIVPEGCSGSHQLMLTKENLEAYKKFTAEIKRGSYRANGYIPYLVMQANHSGRYSNPGNKPAPLIAYRHPEYEKLRKADDSYRKVMII